MDTNVAIEFIRRSTTAYARLNPDATVYVPVIVLGELFPGAWNAMEPSGALAEVEDFAAKVKILVCDLGVARRFGELRRDLWRKGKPIPDDDIWIAATAIVHGLPVLTNDEHFRQIENLDIASW